MSYPINYRLENNIFMSSQMIMMLPALLFLILQTNLLFFSVQSICVDNGGNYTVNSTYANNLDTALSSIPANIGTNSFYNVPAGSQNPRDIAYAIALCGGDINPDLCRRCIQDLTARLRTNCPNQRQAVDWADNCMLRYSNQTMLGIMATWPGATLSNPQNTTNANEFTRDLRGNLDFVRDRAAKGGPMRKVAAGNVRGPSVFEDIYALVQCTPDLSTDECNSCLIAAATEIPGCCDGKRGGRVLYPSCNLRYETYPFYNDTRLRELAPLTPSPGTNNTTRAIIIVIVSVVVFVILSFFVCFLFRKRIKHTPVETHETGEEITTVESLKYTLSTIRAATDDFSEDNKLGEGGFGVVYKGKLLNDQEIAVKRLSKNSGQGDQEIKNEVLLLAKLQHRNLVRLLGFCLEGNEKLLIYEFVQNGSLDQFIFDPVKRSYLDWDKRSKIIVGIARGILYLHEDSQVRIIHRDLKPSNVLLDEAMNPKIADFGLARLFGHDDTHVKTSKIARTFGYMAPEYAMHGKFSVKSDVFSFGVLILEIISGEKNKNVRRGEIIEDLLSFAWQNWHGRTLAEIVDPWLRSCPGSISDMVRYIHIALLCVRDNAADRPTMTSVVLMLISSSITLEIPSEPAFLIPSDYGSETSALLRDKKSANSNVQYKLSAFINKLGGSKSNFKKSRTQQLLC